MLESQLLARRLKTSLLFNSSCFIRVLYLHMAQELYDLILEIVQQLLEQFEGFALVLLFGILLRISAQMNTLPKVIHGGEVLLPQGIENLQHDLLLDLVHIITDRGRLGIVRSLYRRHDFRA